MTTSFTFGKILLSPCDSNRANQSYVCTIEREVSRSIDKNYIVGIATLASVSSLVVVIPGLYLLTKDYFDFIQRVRSKQQNQQQGSRGAIVNSQPDNHPTLQNMLGEDYECPRRSINKNFHNPQTNIQNHNPLFQINEAIEDEDHFSPSKQKLQSGSKQILSENKNVLNTSALNQSLQVPKTADDENRINDLPQFNSYTKTQEIDEDVARSYAQRPLKSNYSQDILPHKAQSSKKQGINRPSSSVLKTLKQNIHQRNLNSAAGFTDSTNTFLIDQHNIIQNSTNKDLEIEIIEEEENKHSSIVPHESSKVQSSQESGKEESKDVDSSRVYMMIKNKVKSDSIPQHNQWVKQEERTTPKRMLITSLILLTLTVFVILSIVYIVFEMYNMTSFGLQVSLRIFGFGIAIDLLLMRPLIILVLSIIQELRSSKQTTKQLSISNQDEEEIALLGTFYEEYELPLHSYFQQSFNSSLFNSMTLKIDDNSRNHLNNMDDIERQQQPQDVRLIKVQSKKKGYRGELMLIESTFYYHDDGQSQRKKDQTVKGEHQVRLKEREQIRRPTVVREKVDVSGSLVFDATEEARFKKAIGHDMKMNEDSNYDIEDIPMNSSRGHQNDRGSFLPPIQPQMQQFETPKGMGQTKIVFNIPEGLNASQQLVTFNECRDLNNQGFLLKDLIPISSSSKKNKALKIHQDYQSLERYLNKDDQADKENANSINRSIKRQSQLRESITSSLRHQQYLDDQQNVISPNNEIYLNANEVYKFTPQYSSLQKQVSRTKDSKRQSIAADIFSDLKQVNLLSQLQERPNKLRKNCSLNKELRDSKVLSNNGTQRKIQTLLTGRKSIHSPTGSSIKETLEHRINQMQENTLIKSQKKQDNKNLNECHLDEDKQGEICLQSEENNKFLNEQPFLYPTSPSKEFNLLQSTDFNQVSDKNQRIRRSGDRRISEQLQPQLLLRKSREKHQKRLFESKFQSSNEQTLMGSDYQTKVDSQKIDIKNKHVKPQLKKKRHQRKESQATYQTDGTKSYGLSMNGQQVHELVKAQRDLIKYDKIEDSRHDETSRSKIFEDSDTSTFRLISFTAGASKQKSKKNLHSRQPSSQFHTQAQSEVDIPNNIDFYSNTNSQKDQMDRAEQFRTHEMGKIRNEVIIEENLITHHSSPERINHIQIQDSNESFSNESSLSNNDQSKQQKLAPLQKFNTQMNQNIEDEGNSFDEEQNIASRLTNRKSGNGSKRAPSQLQGRYDKGKIFGQERATTPSYDTVNSYQKAMQEKRQKKEDLELLMLRIEEQKRKLKHFLKLARQLKSSKDEKKIKEFLKFLKEQQKPLPYARIQELKSLEIMSSPYNQSLIDMIRDEYNQFKQGDQMKSKKPSKSQNRLNEVKNGQLINKLSGIYGSQIRKTKSREGSTDVDNYRTKNVFTNHSKNRFGRGQFTSKDSVSSNDIVPSKPPKQNIRGRNQPLLIVEGTINSSFAIEQTKNEEGNISVDSDNLSVQDKINGLNFKQTVSQNNRDDFNDLHKFMI